MSTEEKVEMEAVPLKTDTDEKTEGTEETVLEKKEAPKKTWFFSKTEKKKIEDDIEEGKEKTKKKCFWRCEKKEKKEGGEEEEVKPEMTIGIDVQMRDEKQINDHVKISFEDVFGEPDTFHSFDCMWRANYRVFEWTRTNFYKIFALFCFPFTFFIAILFALFAVLNNLIVIPLSKLAAIPFAWISMFWSFLVANIFNPITNSFANCFSKVTVRNYGINNAPTDLMQA